MCIPETFPFLPPFLLFFFNAQYHARFVRRFSNFFFIIFFLRFTVQIKATMLRFTISFPRVFQGLTRERIVENSNDRFRTRIVSLYRFFRRTTAVRSYIAKNKPRRFQISRDARLDFFFFKHKRFINTIANRRTGWNLSRECV